MKRIQVDKLFKPFETTNFDHQLSPVHVNKPYMNEHFCTVRKV